MTIPSKYDASKVEDKWYDYWMKNNYFHSEVDHSKESYTIVIPPPNVTGVLHMGHMLNNTIQDVLVRRARLLGKNACWVPGTDHASIATEAKVVAKLKEQGISKSDLTREEFLQHAFDWKDEYGGIILEQLKKLGASCDWERTAFTMDPEMSESVIKVFVDLYNKGLIYRGYRMVNWDPEAKTTLSDEEVIHEERQGNLYYLKYKILSPALSKGKGVEQQSELSSSESSSPLERLGEEEFLTIATTRPETIFGDTAICINPNDERFTHLKGKKAIVPLCGRVIPIIEDEYVDLEFGTGCLKVTPAHDENDKILGDKHNLEVIDIFNEDASLNAFGLHYQGKDRFVVRAAIAKELEEKGILVKTEVHTNKVGTSERTKAVIEPRLSDQWFLKMTDLAKPAIDAVLGDDTDINLYPKKFENTYRHWMENVRDWNISRQLWWGQQIPAYYYISANSNGQKEFVVAESKEEALKLAWKKSNDYELTLEDLTQDEDALDTWFSSWLWPMSVFDGIRNPENEEIKYYYPTNDLVTGPDILFFWVARMIVAGYEYKGEKPFENVYLTGLVRDKQRRKMSKSLGNSPDALKLIETYGADGVRVGLLLSSAAGNDLMFDEDLCQQGKGFANKIWNAFRLIKGWEVDETLEQPETAKIGLIWYEAKFQKTLAEIEDHFSKYRLSDALMAIYKLIMDDFSSWLLEIVKPAYQQPIDKITFDAIIEVLENNLKVLHPFMPFLTEEIWQFITERTSEEALIIAKYPLIDKNESIGNACEAYYDYLKLYIKNSDKNTFTNKEMSKLYGKSTRTISKYHLKLRKSNKIRIVKKVGGIGYMYEFSNLNNILESFEFATGVVSGIRTIRKEKNISFKDEVELFVVDAEQNSKEFDVVIQKLTNTSAINYVSEKVDGASFRVKSNEYFVPISAANIDVEAEIKKLEAELKRAEGFLFGITKKLSNERFVANAPEKVIALERKKEADTLAKIETIKSSLGSLK